MSNLNYTQTIQLLEAQFSKELPLQTSEQLNGQFTLVSAGLCNYLPAIPYQQHADLFTKIHLHKKLSILEQETIEALDYTVAEQFDAATETLLKNHPVIICTFHTGSYRLINLFLARHKISYSLVVGKDIIEKEGKMFLRIHEELSGNPDSLKLINAESPGSGIQMLKDLKKGRSLLIYLDGNTGAGEQTETNGNHCIINFLNQQLYVRKGAAYLAHAVSVPIVPVVCYRKSLEQIRLRFFEPIYPAAEMDRTAFADQTMQRLYDLAAPVITAYPEQWEAWLYLHKVVRIINPPVGEKIVKLVAVHPEKVIFNAAAFGLYKISGHPFLFRKSSYFSYAITGATYRMLSSCLSGAMESGKINARLFAELYHEQVLIDA